LGSRTTASFEREESAQISCGGQRIEPEDEEKAATNNVNKYGSAAF